MAYRDKKQIEITNHNAMLIHSALAHYSRHINKDTLNELYELAEIDKAIGYEGIVVDNDYILQ